MKDMPGCETLDDFIAELEKDPEMKEAIASARKELTDGVFYLNVATHNTIPLTETQIRSAVYGCTADKCVCGKCP